MPLSPAQIARLTAEGERAEARRRAQQRQERLLWGCGLALAFLVITAVALAGFYGADLVRDWLGSAGGAAPSTATPAATPSPTLADATHTPVAPAASAGTTTPDAAATPGVTVTPSLTETRGATATGEATPAPVPTDTSAPTATRGPTVTPSPSVTPVAISTPSRTPTASQTATRSPSPSRTPWPTPTALLPTPSVTPTREAESALRAALREKYGTIGGRRLELEDIAITDMETNGERSVTLYLTMSSALEVFAWQPRDVAVEYGTRLLRDVEAYFKGRDCAAYVSNAYYTYNVTGAQLGQEWYRVGEFDPDRGWLVTKDYVKARYQDGVETVDAWNLP